jgi:hypothetical protein
LIIIDHIEQVGGVVDIHIERYWLLAEYFDWQLEKLVTVANELLVSLCWGSNNHMSDCFKTFAANADFVQDWLPVIDTNPISFKVGKYSTVTLSHVAQMPKNKYFHMNPLFTK